MSNKKIKILVADDEPIGRDLLEAILFPEGYDLVFSKNGEEALNAAIEHHPDIILLDVMMPVIDGFEVCIKIRSIEEIAHTPIFLITALDDRDSKIRGIDAGADDYISKPFDRIEILAKIKNSTNLISYRNQNKKTQQTASAISETVTIDPQLFEWFCNLHLTHDPKDEKVLIHRSISPANSIHAFFNFTIKTGTCYCMVSNSLKNKEAVITNLLLKELLLQNARKNSDSPLRIVQNTLREFEDFSAKYSIAKSKGANTSVLFILYNKESGSFLVSGNNQSLYVCSAAEENEKSLNNSTYQSFHLSVDQEFEIVNPKNVFLFSSNVFETFSEQDLSSFLNENFSAEKQVNLSKAIEKFNDNRDIIVVNLSI